MNRLRRTDDAAQAHPADGVGIPFSRRSPPRRAPKRQPVLMIADDTADVRELYRQYFRDRGYIVVTAPDGAAAIQLALEHVPDVTVMDLAMPQYDGLTAIQKIKEDPRGRRIRVILLTGYPMESVARGARDLRRGQIPHKARPLEYHVNDLRRPVRRVAGSS
jgi:CheY-like chemotaxis protein